MYFLLKVRPFLGASLPETNIFAPENGYLEYFLLSYWGFGLFAGA